MWINEFPAQNCHRCSRWLTECTPRNTRSILVQMMFNISSPSSLDQWNSSQHWLIALWIKSWLTSYHAVSTSRVEHVSGLSIVWDRSGWLGLTLFLAQWVWSGATESERTIVAASCANKNLSRPIQSFSQFDSVRPGFVMCVLRDVYWDVVFSHFGCGRVS